MTEIKANPEFAPNLELLREFRRRRGINQKDMAFALGYKSESPYAMMELGQREINVKAANAISTVLGFSADECLMVFFPSFA